MDKQAYSHLNKLAEGRPLDWGSIKSTLDDYKHIFIPGAAGAAIGGLGGLAATPLVEHPEKERRNWTRNALLGALLLGGAGAGAGYVRPDLAELLSQFTTSTSPDATPDTQAKETA
jgi:hypothetical protein